MRIAKGIANAMSIRNILIHPDPRLKTKTKDMVAPIDGLKALIDDMFETMYDAPGIGLAAPQIGILERLFVMDTEGPENPKPQVFINPKITWAAEELSQYDEGCLSIPDVYETVTRPAAIKLSYLNQDFEVQEKEFSGLDATCVQHELDHLNGKLFIDHLSQLKRSMITKKMQKLKKETDRGSA